MHVCVWCKYSTSVQHSQHTPATPPLHAVRPTNTLTSTPVLVHQINHTLTCSFDGLPRPTVTWRLNGTTLVTGRDNYVIREMDNTSHVDIVGTTLSNSGDYECEVQNLLGSDSKGVSLTVQGEGRVPGGYLVCTDVVCVNMTLS